MSRKVTRALSCIWDIQSFLSIFQWRWLLKCRGFMPSNKQVCTNSYISQAWQQQCRDSQVHLEYKQKTSVAYIAVLLSCMVLFGADPLGHTTKGNVPAVETDGNCTHSLTMPLKFCKTFLKNTQCKSLPRSKNLGCTEGSPFGFICCCEKQPTLP